MSRFFFFLLSKIAILHKLSLHVTHDIMVELWDSMVPLAGRALNTGVVINYWCTVITIRETVIFQGNIISLTPFAKLNFEFVV